MSKTIILNAINTEKKTENNDKFMLRLFTDLKIKKNASLDFAKFDKYELALQDKLQCFDLDKHIVQFDCYENDKLTHSAFIYTSVKNNLTHTILQNSYVDSLSEDNEIKQILINADSKKESSKRTLYKLDYDTTFTVIQSILNDINKQTTRKTAKKENTTE